jgi:hypothetical protein
MHEDGLQLPQQREAVAEDEWKLRPEASENHWLDCLVGCAVAASMQGAVLPGTDGPMAPRRQQRVKLSSLQRKRK